MYNNNWYLGNSITLSNGQNIQEFIHKKNNMIVVIAPNHNAPIAGYMRVVKAGSRDEATVCGKGVAHFIEHMAFRIDGGKFWKFERLGHEDNAMTQEDATSFYDFGHHEHLADVIKVDGSRFKCNEVPADGIPIEMKAVLNEKERNKEASGILFQTAQATCQLFSTYHIPTIGLRHDIEKTSADDMKHFREKFYKLNNTTFVVTGHVHVPDVLENFHKIHGDTPDTEKINHNYGQDINQIGKRIIELNTPAPCSMLMLTYHSPPAATNESICLSLLGKIIMNDDVGRGRKLKEDRIVHSIGVYAPRKRDSYMWCLHATMGIHTREALRKAENAMINMLKECQSTITDEELNNAKETLKMEWSDYDTIHSITMALGEAAALGDWKDIYNRLEMINTITKEDVMNTVVSFLKPEKCTSVRLFPTEKRREVPNITPFVEMKHDKATVDVVRKKLNWSVRSSVLGQDTTRFQTLYVNNGNPSLSLSIPFNSFDEYKANIFMECLGNNCQYKTKELNNKEIQNKIISYGVERYFNTDHQYIHLNATFKKDKYIEKGCNFIVNGEFLNSTISSNVFNEKKGQILAELRSMQTNQKYMAKEALINSLFINSPYSENLKLKIHKMEKLNLTKLNDFVKDTIQKPYEWLCTLTTKDPVFKKRIAKYISSHKINHNQKMIHNNWIRTPLKYNSIIKKVQGYSSGLVLIGQTTQFHQYDRETHALMLAMQPLGSSITSRLMDTIRVKKGCGTYGVYGNVYTQPHSNTYLVFNATFTPSDQKKGVQLMKDIIKDWVENGITSNELKIAKQQLIGARSLEMDDIDSVTSVFHRHLLSKKNPTNEWNTYTHNINTLTLEEVNQCISTLDSEKFSFVQVGPEDTDFYE